MATEGLQRRDGPSRWRARQQGGGRSEGGMEEPAQVQVATSWRNLTSECVLVSSALLRPDTEGREAGRQTGDRQTDRQADTHIMMDLVRCYHGGARPHRPRHRPRQLCGEQSGVRSRGFDRQAVAGAMGEVAANNGKKNT